MQNLTDDETRSLRSVTGMMIPASTAHAVPGADDDTIFVDIISSIGRDLAHVKQALRPTLRIYDEKGQPLGQIKSTDLTYPAPIVGMGAGGSVGVRQGGRVVYLRGLDVVTDNVKTNCKPVQTAARAKGSAYAAQNMGLGGAADCQ